MKESQIIGKPTPQISARDKVTGRARYADDLRVARPLWVKILRSPHASAKIRRIDASAARRVPGVKAVVTGADFPHTFGVLAISKDEPVLAKERVRCVGEGVAAVAAETELAAEEALQKIQVEYEPTPPVLTLTEAYQKTVEPIHPELKRENNLHKSVSQQFGNTEEGFKDAEFTLEERYSFLPVTHGFTEPHAVQVELVGDGDVTVYSSTQVPHYLHKSLAEVLEIPAHRIRVVKPHLGGGFGGKGDPFPHEMIAVKLALMTGRNTRLLLTREDVFYSHHGRHPTDLKMKLGFDPKKGITALDADIRIDGGAYASFGVVTTYYNGVLLHGPYKLPNYSFKCDRMYTNKPMCGAMRGHGGVNPRFAFETLLDAACAKAGLDPCETRLSMLHDEYTLTPNQFRITSCGMREGLREAMARTRWKERHGRLPFGKGIGVACGFFISGSALPIHWNEHPQSTVRLTIEHDGAITLYSGASDIGQGSDTMLAQMAAEVLGVPMAMIKVVSADTRLCPVDLGSYSSRVTFMAGNAARNAAIQMRRILVEAAACKLGVPAPSYESRPEAHDDFFRQGGKKPRFDEPYLGPNPDYSDGFELKALKIGPSGGAQLDYLEVVQLAMANRGALQANGVYISPKLGGNFKGAGAGLSPAYSYTAFISEVTVDPETGFIKVDKVTCAHDCGTPLNPLAVEGQLEGSIHMGLGQALMEGMIYEKGVLRNASFLEYKIPSAFEQPEIDIVPVRSRDNEGPFGAKEVGEGALAPLIPSVANAVYDAIGVRLTDLPMTPDRVLAALDRKKKGARP